MMISRGKPEEPTPGHIFYDEYHMTSPGIEPDTPELWHGLIQIVCTLNVRYSLKASRIRHVCNC
jgi:hypothetical protein